MDRASRKNVWSNLYPRTRFGDELADQGSDDAVEVTSSRTVLVP
jgi:hypothetical protein